MLKYRQAFLIFVLPCLVAACRLGENQAIISSPVTLSNQPFINTLKKPLRTTGHFSYLSIAIPKEYRLDQDAWCVRKQDERKIKIEVKLITKEGKVHDFQHISFGFGEGKQYLNLSSDLKYDPDIVYTQVSITSSEAITVDEIQWWSIDKQDHDLTFGSRGRKTRAEAKKNMFNQLEHDILEWFQGKYPKSTLADQLSSAKFVSRRWTRVGFYVDIEVDKNLSRLKMADYGGSFPISGPGIESDEIHHNGGCLLWGK